MANTLKFKRGLVATIPTAALGEPLFTTDTFDLYIGNGTGNTRFQKYIASGATTQILRGDGSLYTFPLAISSPSAGQVLKYDGTNWVNDSDAGITGSGAAGQVAYFTGATTQGGSNNLFWDSANNRLGIGTNAPLATQEISIANNAVLLIRQNTASANGKFAQLILTHGTTLSGASDKTYQLVSNGRADGEADFALQYWNGSTYLQTFRSFYNGNILIGSNTSDSGEKFQVNGGVHLYGNNSGSTSDSPVATIRLEDIDTSVANGQPIGKIQFWANDGTVPLVGEAAYILAKSAGSSGGGYMTFGTSDAATLAAERMRLTANGRLLLGSTTDNGLRFQVTGDGYFSGALGVGSSALTGFNLRLSKTITGATTSYGVSQEGSVQTDVTSAAYGFNNVLNTAASTTLGTYAHIRISQNSIGAGTTITNQHGILINDITAGTSNFGIYNNINAGTNKWGYYGAGTANNYMAGSLGIGTTTLTGYTLAVGKNITGSINAQAIRSVGVIQSDVTSKAYYYTAQSFTANANFALPDLYLYAAFGGTLSNITAGGSITNQYGYFVDSSLTGATNNFGFYGNIAAGTGRWNLYMNGSAANYVNGKLLLGSTTDISSVGKLVTVFSSDVAYGITLQNTYTAAVNTGYFLRAYNSSTEMFGINIQNETTSDVNISYRNNLGFSNGLPSGTRRMTLDASGNLGLGTASPSGYGAGYVAMDLRSTTGAGFKFGNSTDAGLLFANSTSTILRTQSLKPLIFGTFDTERMRIFAGGNVFIGASPVDAGFLLDVNGTMRVSGASTFGGNMTISKNENNITTLNISNTTAGTGSQAYARLTSDASSGVGQFGKYSSITTTYKILTASDTYLYNGTAGDIAILNDFASGSITMAAGGSSTAQLTIASTGAATFSSSVTAAGNITSSDGTSSTIVQTATNAPRIVLIDGRASGRRFDLGSLQSGAGTFSITDATAGLARFTIAGDGTAIFSGNVGIGSTGASYKLDVTGEARVSNAIAIGTTPDTNKPFKILKNINGTVGINFENTSTGSSAFSAIQMGTDVSGGTKFTNLVYASSGVTASGVYNPDGTSLINNGSGGLNFLGTPIRFYTGGSNGTLRYLFDNEGAIQYTATTPTTNAVDGYKQYSADVVAGNAAPHFRTENGAVIKLYQETTGVGNAIMSLGGGTPVLDDTTFDGYTLKQVIKALRNQGILA